MAAFIYSVVFVHWQSWGQILGGSAANGGHALGGSKQPVENPEKALLDRSIDLHWAVCFGVGVIHYGFQMRGLETISTS